MQAQSIDEARVMCKRWNTLYPAYLNKEISIAKGRRVPSAIAIPHPNIYEMSECLESLKVHHMVETDKAYPKDWYTPGRIKVFLTDENGKTQHPEFPSSTLHYSAYSILFLMIYVF